MQTLINSINISTIADYVIITRDKKLFNNDILKNNCIIFCDFDDLNYLFSNIQRSENKYILITHLKPYPINIDIIDRTPKCVKRWYGKNIIFKDDKYIPIPIGTQNHIGYQKQDLTTFDYEWFINNLERLKKKQKNLTNPYCNWSNLTNPKERINVVDEINVNCVIDKYIPFKEYCEIASRHKFIISPMGVGIDCYRTWEAIYMGCIPIVKKNYMYDYWGNLPIVQVNEWSEVTAEFLQDILAKEYTFNKEKAHIEYWEKLIKEDFKQIINE